MIKYKTTECHPFIEKVNCVDETECFVFIEYQTKLGKFNRQRYRKVTDNYQFFDTWQEAKDHLVGVALKRVEEVECDLDRASLRFSLMKDLREV